MKKALVYFSRIVSCLFCLVFLESRVYCQTANQSTDLKNIVTPSPTATALGVYGNTPVGLYAGTSQISVPLFEIQEGALKLPISLSYHAGGIKVAEHGLTFRFVRIQTGECFV